jgi:hypothetical protein
MGSNSIQVVPEVPKSEPGPYPKYLLGMREDDFFSSRQKFGNISRIKPGMTIFSRKTIF